MEISDLTDKEFKTMNIKMFTELRRKMEEYSENFIKEKIQKEKNRGEQYNN